MSSRISEEGSSEVRSSEVRSSVVKEIFWTTNNGWSTITKSLGYPRPQNITMYQVLTPSKKASLNKAYNSVYGNSVDNVDKNWTLSE